MEFQLSADQLAIMEAVSRFLEDEWDVARRRAALDHPPAALQEELWRQIVEMGWVGISVAEERGGSGQELLTAAILAEQAGRVLLPHKLTTALVSAHALEQCGEDASRQLLETLVNGDRFVSPAIDENNGFWGPEHMVTCASMSGANGRISGVKILVPDADVADEFLVGAKVNGMPVLVRIPSGSDGVSIVPMERMDGQSIAQLSLQDVSFESHQVIGGLEDGNCVINRVYDFWTTLVSADLLGVTSRALEMTNQYAKDRHQFGKPIGSFQAVSHRLADVKVEEEVGRSLLYGACLALQEHPDTASVEVSAAKAWLNDTAVNAGEAALQLHGGVGYTWELDVHLYLRQARSNAVYLGDTRFHRGRVGAHIVSLIADAKRTERNRAR